MRVRRAATPVLLAALLATSGCSSGSGQAAGERTPGAAGSSAAASSSAVPSSAVPSPSATGTTTPEPTPTTALPPVTDPASLPALIRTRYDGRDLHVGRVLNRTDRYVRHFVTYRSGRLRISGILNLPRGKGPHPVVILLHGHIETSIYVNGQGMLREQDYLARRGFAVLHVDYRNHAQSDRDPSAERDLRLGYTEDAINAVLAVKRSNRPDLDPEKIAIFGRSMGGGVVLNTLVVAPGLVKAAVAFAPVSARAGDNFNRFIRGDGGDSALTRQIIRRHGAPEDNPAYWRTVDALTYVDRISDPLMIQHGTVDESCPIRWTRRTAASLRAAGKDVRLTVYPGEGHNFAAAWPPAMRRTVAFLRAQLDA